MPSLFTIPFSAHGAAMGRNGRIAVSEVLVSAFSDEIQLTPITSRKRAANAYLQFPDIAAAEAVAHAILQACEQRRAANAHAAEIYPEASV